MEDAGDGHAGGLGLVGEQIAFLQELGGRLSRGTDDDHRARLDRGRLDLASRQRHGQGTGGDRGDEERRHGGSHTLTAAAGRWSSRSTAQADQELMHRA